jgi:hypothetical protein
MQDTHHCATSTTARPSLFARYRAWERRLYMRQISDPQDQAGMDAYANYFWSWRGWWIHAVELLLAAGLALLLRQWAGVPFWLGVLLGYVIVSVLAAYIILAWYTPRFYVKMFKGKFVKIVPFMLAGLVAGVIAGAMAKSLQTKGRIPTAAEFTEVFARAVQEPVVWLAVGGMLLWAALLAGVARARKVQLEQENALLLAASERDQAARGAGTRVARTEHRQRGRKRCRCVGQLSRARARCVFFGYPHARHERA